MERDCISLKADSHQVCQDYSFYDNWGHGVYLSDGCSSTPNSEVGSMIVARTNGLMDKAEKIAILLGLDRKCLDATLISLVNTGDKIEAKFFGDGYLYAKFIDGTDQFIQIHSLNEHPTYLSYLLNKEAFNKNKESGLYDCNIITNNNSQIYRPTSPSEPTLSVSYDLSQVRSVSVFTDGLDRFLGKSGNFYHAYELAKQFTVFPVSKGEFIKRKANQIRNWLKSEEVRIMDDFSIGSIIL